VSGWSLRLFRDRLAGAASRALPPAARVLYAHTGDVVVTHDGVTATVTQDSAWHGAGACTARAGAAGATLLRWELVRTAAGRDGEVVLEQVMDLVPGGAWLMRCDRVDFDPGGVAPWHRHRGGGIRCLLQGRLEVTVGEGAPRAVAPGEAWFESGREPVLAVAAPRAETSFIRFSILPAAIRGQSSILYVDPAAAAGGRPRRYTVYVDEPIAL
jgi:quercetin dioxygenase-like cupin family protein